MNYTADQGTAGGWKPGCTRSIDLISDSNKPTIRGKFEELDDEADQWRGQRTDEDEVKGDLVPLRAIKVVTSIEQL